MNLLEKLIPEFTSVELIERIMEKELYLQLTPTIPSTITRSNAEKDLKQLIKEFDKRNIKKIRKQKLEQLNESAL